MFGYLPGEYEVIDLVLTLVCQHNARITVVNTLSIGMKQIQISPPGRGIDAGNITYKQQVRLGYMSFMLDN
jgi:hypothetical protein